MNKKALLSLVLFAFVLLTGCRTYGDYGSEQATYDQIEKINQRFAGDLDKARGELEPLQQAAARDRELGIFVTRYEALLEEHEAMIEEHRVWTEQLKVRSGALGRLTSSYRDLSRALGSITADQLAVKAQYEQFASDLAMGGRDHTALPQPMSRYQAAPPYYERIRVALEKRSINDALSMRN